MGQREIKEFSRTTVKMDWFLRSCDSRDDGRSIESWSARDCQALIPFSRGLLPARSKLVGPALNTRNTVSIGYGHRGLSESLPDPWFPASLSTPVEIRLKGKRRDESERARVLELENGAPDGCVCTVYYPSEVFPHLCFHGHSLRSGETSRTECR